MFLIVLAGILAAALIASMMHLSSPPYIPPRDADLVNWATNFSTTITASPATYGLTGGDATTIASAVAAFNAAYLIGGGTYHAPVNPATKTPASTQAKNDARTAMLAIVRPYAQQVANNAGVSSDDKIALGLNPRTNAPTPIAAPTSYPIIGFRGAQPLSFTLQYQDSAAGTGKAKPYGVIHAEVRAGTSATPITDANLIPYYGVTTKSPLVVNFDSSDAGKVAYVAMRWLNSNGKAGPWGAIFHANVLAAS